ncbi:MAG: hypothetical protein WC631_03340 [Candidatus Paceibacterota bacterium]|jgi:hypothetical protein
MNFEMPPKETLEKDMLAKVKDSIPTGQEWRVGQLLKCEIIVKAGAKLTVTEMAAKNKIIVEEGGELEITGQDLVNEITRGGQVETASAQEEKTETPMQPQNNEVQKDSVAIPENMSEHDRRMLDISRKEVETILGMTPEGLTKMEKVADMIKKMPLIQNAMVIEGLTSSGAIDKKIGADFIIAEYNLRVDLALKILQWPDSARETVETLLGADGKDPNKRAIETYVSDKKKMDDFLKTGVNNGLDQYQVMALNEIRKEKGL